MLNLPLIRLEAIKAAAKVQLGGGVGSLLIQARWLEDFIVYGTMPEVASISETDCIPTRLRPKHHPRS